MDTFIHSTLVVLCVFFAGMSAGLILGGLVRAAKLHDTAFGEHESDAPYPRFYE
ncbi:hypothetical protein [Paraburkholderia fungorum]|uniref:hypothetical protein n=1 Tax=Paraburkholderia fungorum TaxID=134537 RepID=UPI001C1EBB0D|nr:hypothetical protein [Paraburkholderia fungorum]MBU7436489.1 hypothetical protein [Paraburkholderia fungorum]